MTSLEILARRSLQAAALVFAAAFAIPAQAQPDISYRYEFVKLDYPKAAASYPLGINAKRQIVGTWVDASGIFHGYLYEGGKFTSIEYPGALQSQFGGTFAAGLNDRGDISGTFTDKNGFQHGFIRVMPSECEDEAPCKPVFKQIDFPGAVQTQNIFFELGPGLGTAVAGINNHSDVAGLYATQGLWSNAFKFANGHFTSIDDPAATHAPAEGSRSFGLNDYGDVVGSYLNQASPTVYPINYGFVFDGKKYIPVFVKDSDKGFFGTQANGINNRQEVVGVYSDVAGNLHGLYWVAGQSFTIDFPKMPYSEVHVINNRGDVTGAYLVDPTVFNPAYGYPYRGFVAFLKDE
jgi:hypothetical protein